MACGIYGGCETRGTSGASGIRETCETRGASGICGTCGTCGLRDPPSPSVFTGGRRPAGRMRYTLGYVESFSSKKYRFDTKKCVCAASQSRLRPAGGSVRRSWLRRTRVFAGGGIGNVLNGFGLAFASGTNEKTCTEPLLFRAQFFFVSFCALHALVPAHAKGPPVSERTAPVWCLCNGLADAASVRLRE